MAAVEIPDDDTTLNVSDLLDTKNVDKLKQLYFYT